MYTIEILKENSNYNVKSLIKDGSGEFNCNLLIDNLRKKCIIYQKTIGEWQQKNGVAERKIQTNMRCVQVVFAELGFLILFWAERDATAVFFVNSFLFKES
jgi:hypothetical protein